MQSTLVDRLNETLEHAARSTGYYAERFAGIDLRMGSVADLRRLPLLSRATLERRVHEMLAGGCVPVTVSMTGGTTQAADGSQHPLLIFRTRAESQARWEALEATLGRMSPRPLLMHLVNLGHGYETIAGLEGCFQMAIERPFQIDAILALLRHRFAFPGYTSRVKALAGALRLLKALTLSFMERGIDGGELGLELVSSSSNHLTSRWRAILGDYWKAPVDDAYGLSEVPGLHATRCTSCGHFHFSPAVVAEFLRLDRDEPVERGVGRVVGTALVPLATMLPIIRYDTDDVVEVTGRCEARDAVGFELVGRRSQVIALPGAGGPRVIASPIALNEVLDGVPDIAVQEFAFVRPLGLRSTLGVQCWGLRFAGDGSPRRLELGMELRWSPREHPAAARALVESLRERVLAASPGLVEAISGGEVDFQIVPHEPGTSDLRAYL